MTMTTLNAIRTASPCHDGWTKLLKHLGKTSADDEPLPLLTVLDSNGLDDALWVLDNTECNPRLARHFGAWCAEQVLPIFEAAYPNDMRPRNAIAVSRNDAATTEERAAAWAATRATRDAAWASAKAAARASAWASAWASARASARAAARAATRAAGDAAKAAARDAARAAGDAAQEVQLRKMLIEGF